MKLRNPFYIENLYQDQPYASLILVAPYCDFKCQGCQNKSLGGKEIKDYDVMSILVEYLNNPFVDGITLAGLEPFIGDENDYLIDVLMLIQMARINKITIYTRFDLNNEKVSSYINQIYKLDFVKDLFIKTGEYIQNSKSKEIKLINDNNNIWSITLASENQDFHVIKGNWKKVN